MNNQNALYNCESYEDDYPRMRRDLVIDVRMGVGPQGAKGDQGEKGDAPVKGIDYWTAEDKAYVIAEAESGVIDDVLAAKADAEAARDSAQEAQTAAETAASDADSSKQSAKEYADAAMGYRDEAEQAATAAQTAQGLAETAQSAAETASANASDSETLARNAATDAANAKQDAIDAMLLAQTVDRDIRENLLPTIEGYSTSVTEAKDAAELAQSKAESAQATAEQAKESADISAELAETARVAAETAQGLAEDARDIVLDITDEITATKQDFDVKYNKVDSEYYPAIQEIGVDVSDAKDDVLEAKDWVEKAQYSLAITKDISGNPIEFNDGKEGAFFKQLYVTLSPTMDGSGVPSPSNIRPITGWSEVTLTQNNGEDIVPYTYDWHETAGTIYGGMLNALDGTITVTWTGVVLDGTENWVDGTSSAAGFRTYLRGFSLPSAYNREYCSHLVNVSAGNVGSLKTLDSFGLRADNGILYIYVAGCETVADTKSYLVEQYSRGTPVTVIWELAEPVVYKMDPYVLHTREGFNRIASSVGSITAKYYVDLESAVDEAVDNKVASVSATASTLPAGSEATASYNAETNVFAFGIPTGATGPAGAAGYSPSATVTQTPDGAVIEITDEAGTTSATLTDGKIWDNLDAETDSYTPQVVIPCDDTGTVQDGVIAKRGRVLYINGTIPANTRVCIYGHLAATRNSPAYADYPDWYGDAFDGFVVGHRYTYQPELIDGTLANDSGGELLVLRLKDNTYKSFYAGTSTLCEFLPEAVFVMLKAGTYTNTKVYLHIVDDTPTAVQDVQVNGTSILSNGVANIPTASTSAYGAFKSATVNTIKSGTALDQAVAVGRQYASTFYGLASAAGDTTQSVSDNAVGTYTAEAKAAIQTMLDVPSTSDITVSDVQVNGTSVVNDGVANVSVPTRTSDLINDSNFISDANYNHTDNNYTTSEKEKLSGIEIGAKANVNADWNAASGDAQILNKPTNVSSFTNDVGYLTEHQDISGKANATDTVLNTTLSLGRQEESTIGANSVALGRDVIASGNNSFAGGQSTIASGNASRAEGYGAEASGNNSHAEGNGTIANGSNVHAEGKYNVAQTIISDWVADTHYNVGDKVFHIFTTFNCIEENTDSTWVNAHWEIYNFTSETAVVVGNGATNSSRSNAYMLDWDGNGYYGGNVYVNCDSNSSGGEKLATMSEVVTDVQINNASILQNGVANVPMADNSSPGVVKINPNNGITTSSNELTIIGSSVAQYKSGNTNYRVVTPYGQHNAVFYGLAKAAGDTSQSASSNAVGTYTDEAKVAIQKMLGVYQPPWELLNDITLTEEGRIDLTADANGTPYDLLGVYIRVYYDANLTAASTGYARYLVEDSDGTTLNAETGRYTAQTTSYAKFVYILRDGSMAIAVYSKALATGGGLPWNNKDSTGVKFDFKNIQHIYMNTNDVEPAGTRIQIYGQRAY